MQSRINARLLAGRFSLVSRFQDEPPHFDIVASNRARSTEMSSRTRSRRRMTGTTGRTRSKVYHSVDSLTESLAKQVDSSNGCLWPL